MFQSVDPIDQCSLAETPTQRSKIRVLVLMETYAFSGPARNLLETIRYLVNQVDFHVVTYLRGRAASSDFVENLRASGIAHTVVRERNRYDLRAIRLLHQIVRTYTPDVVQIHNTKSRAYIYLLRATHQLAGARVIDCYHGETQTDLKQLLYNWVDRQLFRLANHIVVVSREQRGLLQSRGVDPSKVTVIHNGIAAIPRARRRDSAVTTIITVGRLSREKGQLRLLHAVRDLHIDRSLDFRLLIVGDGPDENTLRKYTARWRLEKLVQFVGYQRDTNPYYEQADLFVLPSLSEGMPNVLLEAAAHGVPIVSSNVGGVPEMFVHGEEAVLVNVEADTQLADAIADCLSDPVCTRRMADSARRRVMSQFSISRRAEAFCAYYQRIIA